MTMPTHEKLYDCTGCGERKPKDKFPDDPAIPGLCCDCDKLMRGDKPGSAKPCPFCGHDPIIQHSDFTGSFVECYNPDCYLVVRRTGDLDYVLEQWNSRPNSVLRDKTSAD